MWKPISELETFLGPQERFDALTAATFRRFGPKIVDFSYANPYDGPADDVRHALHLALENKSDLSLQYSPYGGKTTTRRLVASKLSAEYGLPFEFRDIIMTPGAMAALNVAFRTIFGPDDEVLVITPCWLDYPLYLQNLGIPFRFVSTTEDKHLDMPAIERALTPKTRGIIFSHPCCPTGVVYSRDEIDALSKLLLEAESRLNTQIYLISDEVHQRLIWRAADFYSPLQSYPRSLRVYSFGKALAIQGQRIGYVAVSPEMPERESMRKQLERCVRATGFCGPTSLMQDAICRLLDYNPRLDLLAQNQEAIRTALTACGYTVCDAPATFFVYVKSPLEDDFTFTELLASHGVLVIPSTLFHERGYFRISVTAKAGSLPSGVRVLQQVLEDLSVYQQA